MLTMNTDQLDFILKEILNANKPKEILNANKPKEILNANNEY